MVGLSTTEATIKIKHFRREELIRMEKYISQRAQQLKNFNLEWSLEIFNPYAWKFQSWIESFNLEWNFRSRLKVSIPTFAIPRKKGPCCVARLKGSLSIEIFNLRLVAWKLQTGVKYWIISFLGPSGMFLATIACFMGWREETLQKLSLSPLWDGPLVVGLGRSLSQSEILDGGNSPLVIGF